MNLWPMLIAAVGCWIAGKQFAQAFALTERTLLGKSIFSCAFAVLIVILVMANMRGFYWSVFPRGHGFFSANRISANLVFLLVAYAGATVNRRKYQAYAGEIEVTR